MANQLKVGSFLSYIQIFIAAIISILYTPFLLQTLGQNEYGMYTLATSMVSYLSLLNLGIGASYIRFYAKYKANNDTESIANLNAIFLITFVVLGTIATILGVVLSQSIDVIFSNQLTPGDIQVTKTMTILLTLNTAISFPVNIFMIYTTAQEHFIFQKVLTIIKTILTPLISVPFLLLGYRSVLVVLSTLIVSIIIDTGYVVYSINNLKMKFKFNNMNFKVLKEVIIFSSFIAINAVIDQVNWNVDQVILGYLHGTSAVAIYGVATTINRIYLQFSTSISSVFVPKIHKIIATNNTKNELNKLFIKVGRIQFIIVVLVCLGFTLFGDYFIYMWAGTDYTEAYFIVLLLIIPVTVPCIQNLGIEIQRAYNKHQFRAKLYLIMACINIAISIPLSYFFSGIGAATGTCISLIVANGIIMNIYYHKVLHLDIKLFWKNMSTFVPPVIITILVGVLIRNLFTINTFFSLLLACTMFSFIYVLVMYLFGMNKEEKALVNNILLINKKRG